MLHDWMNEWMNQLCGPASWGVHSNEYTQKRCMNDAWVAALSAFSVRGFPTKSKKRNKRKRKICTTIKVKLVLTIVCDSKIPWILYEEQIEQPLAIDYRTYRVEYQYIVLCGMWVSMIACRGTRLGCLCLLIKLSLFIWFSLRPFHRAHAQRKCHLIYAFSHFELNCVRVLLFSSVSFFLHISGLVRELTHI